MHADALVQFLGVLTNGNRVEIHHRKDALALFADLAPIAHRADIVAQRNNTAGLNSAENGLLCHFIISLGHKNSF